MYPSELKYTEEHEWIKVEDEVATVGITNFATDELGEIVFCDLPEIGTELTQMDEFGSIESVKTVSSLFLPLTGIITEVNEDVLANPDIINDSPYENGWLVKLNISDIKEIDDLMSAEDYKAHIESLVD